MSSGYEREAMINYIETHNWKFVIFIARNVRQEHKTDTNLMTL